MTQTQAPATTALEALEEALNGALYRCNPSLAAQKRGQFMHLKQYECFSSLADIVWRKFAEEKLREIHMQYRHAFSVAKADPEPPSSKALAQMSRLCIFLNTKKPSSVYVDVIMRDCCDGHLLKEPSDRDKCYELNALCWAAIMSAIHLSVGYQGFADEFLRSIMGAIRYLSAQPITDQELTVRLYDRLLNIANRLFNE
jgi:hypothetical protein